MYSFARSLSCFVSFSADPACKDVMAFCNSDSLSSDLSFSALFSMNGDLELFVSLSRAPPERAVFESRALDAAKSPHTAYWFSL